MHHAANVNFSPYYSTLSKNPIKSDDVQKNVLYYYLPVQEVYIIIIHHNDMCTRTRLSHVHIITLSY